MSAPSQSVIDAIESGETSVTRRAEIYEADGTTLWLPGGESDSRLIDGNVTVDYARAERRGLDISLENYDNALRPDSAGGFWYDKIIKVFRGNEYRILNAQPKIVVVSEPSVSESGRAQVVQGIRSLGYTDVTYIHYTLTSFAQVSSYDIIVTWSGSIVPTLHSILNEAYLAGRAVCTIGTQWNEVNLPFVTASTPNVSVTWGVTPPLYDTPVADGWTTSGSFGTFTGDKIAAYNSTARQVATWNSSGLFTSGLIAENTSGGRWAHLSLPTLPHNNTQAKTLWANMISWLWNFESNRTWETQVGEFMIDNISEPNWPYETKVTCRDYTKKCLNSKLEKSASFSAGTPLSLFVRSIAANAGITKMQIPDFSETLGATLTFERGTPRWEIIKKAAESNNYDLFFDQWGYLVMRPYNDPALSPLSWTFQTGVKGNLVTWDRSTNDSRIYNHVVVTGEQSQEGGAAILPFYGEARNDEPSSPTRIERIGDRSYFFTSTFFTSDAQCEAVALRWLKEKALESYELNWSSFNYPWMDAGEIVEFLDPRRGSGEPTRFLMDTLNIPLGLGPMNATGKRVTFVQDSSMV